MFGLAFHHIGVACRDIEKAATFIRTNFTVSSDTGTVFDPHQNAFVRLFNEGEDGALELVSGPAVAKTLERGTSYYHVCYLTPDMEATLLQAKQCGAILVSGPKPAVLFAMRRIAWIFTPLGLSEFREDG
jgi:methylmalonyl-CoA/ethylmalonyl-CoA epimerase